MAGGRRGGGAADNDNGRRVELGPFRLYWRDERQVWTIAWYDDGGGQRSRRICRKATGVGARGEDGKPPQEAVDALADHYAEWRRPVEQPVAEALVEGLLADWLVHTGERNADPVRAADCVGHWLRFFEIERREGRITRGPYVSDVKRSLCERYMKWRAAQPGIKRGTRISGATISRELAALRAALNHAWKNERIPSAPFVPDVDGKDKPGPKELVYTVEQVARLLEAARRLESRHHVHLYIMVMLSTHGRGEAILELDADTQIAKGNIHFLVPGETQTKKRRSIVPIAPTLAPWLEGVTGPLIQFRTTREDGSVLSRPTSSIKTAFEKCLIEAGICEQMLDDKGEPVWLPPRAKFGETEPRPRMKGVGSPNTLRHTISTELHTLDVPEAQIDAAAGHSGEGTNKKHYRHLRPDYMKEFVEGVEAYWRKVGEHTDAHLRHGRATKVVRLVGGKA